MREDYICLFEVVFNILYGLFLYLEPNLVIAKNPIFPKAKPSLRNNVSGSVV